MNITYKKETTGYATLCRMCSEATNDKITEISSFSPELPKLELLVCGHCGTLNYDGEDSVIGYESNLLKNDCWIHYTKVLADIY